MYKLYLGRDGQWMESQKLLERPEDVIRAVTAIVSTNMELGYDTSIRVDAVPQSEAPAARVIEHRFSGERK